MEVCHHLPVSVYIFIIICFFFFAVIYCLVVDISHGWRKYALLPTVILFCFNAWNPASQMIYTEQVHNRQHNRKPKKGRCARYSYIKLRTYKYEKKKKNSVYKYFTFPATFFLFFWQYIFFFFDNRISVQIDYYIYYNAKYLRSILC